MHIIITTYYFYPELTPRAFRAFELAKGLAKRGHNVTVYARDIGFNYAEFEHRYGIQVNIVSPGFLFNRKSKLKSNDSRSDVNTDRKPRKHGVLRYAARKLLETIYLGGFTFEYSISLFFKLLKNSEKCDLVISIGLPISVHIGTAYYIKKSKSASVADYGDPFSCNPSNHTYWYYKYIERFILGFYNNISIPNISAMPAYTFLKDANRIFEIPQSIDFEEIKTQIYAKNPIPTFCYSGVFYKKIRNPTEFLENLLSIDLEFKFVCYTDFSNKESMDLISPYIEKLTGKLVLIDQLPRIQCIYEMSKFDFLVNQFNSSIIQQPSKLIDYALSKRPIFCFSQNSFNPLDLMKFMKEDYSDAVFYDVTKHDAKIVASQFEKLVEYNNS